MRAVSIFMLVVSHTFRRIARCFQLSRHSFATGRFCSTAHEFQHSRSDHITFAIYSPTHCYRLVDTKPLLEWIRAYFDPAQPGTGTDAWRGARAVVPTNKMPLILQHDGHSRTVIGYEITKSGQIQLLVFDPAASVAFRIVYFQV